MKIINAVRVQEQLLIEAEGNGLKVRLVSVGDESVFETEGIGNVRNLKQACRQISKLMKEI